jgi:hypothetical protein
MPSGVTHNLKNLSSRYLGITEVKYLCDTLLKVSCLVYFPHRVSLRFFRRSTNVEVCLRNLRGCNVGITEKGIYEIGRFDGLRWHDILIKIHVDLFRLSSDFFLLLRDRSPQANYTDRATAACLRS